MMIPVDDIITTSIYFHLFILIVIKYKIASTQAFE